MICLEVSKVLSVDATLFSSVPKVISHPFVTSYFMYLWSLHFFLFMLVNSVIFKKNTNDFGNNSAN